MSHLKFSLPLIGYTPFSELSLDLRPHHATLPLYPQAFIAAQFLIGSQGRGTAGIRGLRDNELPTAITVPRHTCLQLYMGFK